MNIRNRGAQLVTCIVSIVSGSAVMAAAPEAAVFTAMTTKLGELETLAYPLLAGFLIFYITMKVVKKVSNKAT